MKISPLAICVLLSATLVSSLMGQETATRGEEELLETPQAYEERIKSQGGFLEMSLNDAIRLALTNNLELEIENYNEDLNRQRVIGTRGFYDPTLAFSVGWNSIERPNTRTLDAGAGVLTSIRKQWLFESTLQQNVLGGGAFTLDFSNNRATTNDNFSFVNPQYGSSLQLNFTQPLLRGFRETQTERQIKLFNLDTEISDSQFQQRVSEIIQQVENQYWELAFAIENYEARRRSLELAIIQYHNNQKRVEIGVMAPIEITASRAEVATREQELIQSQVQIINAQNNLKQLLAPDPRASVWNLSLLPTEDPQVRDVTISLDAAIDTALGRRPELDQIRLELNKVEVDRSYYRREGKPAIDLRVGFTSNGTSGQVFDPITGNLVDTSPFSGAIDTAWGQVFGFDFLNYVAAVDVEIPLRNRNNEAQLAQVAITERQWRSRMKNRQQLIMVEVRNAYEEIATRREVLRAARMARELSEEQLEGETKRFEAGLSTNFEVLRYQRDLAEAQVRELRAMVDYQIALTSLQKAMFTIIDENDIVTARREPGIN